MIMLQCRSDVFDVVTFFIVQTESLLQLILHFLGVFLNKELGSQLNEFGEFQFARSFDDSQFQSIAINQHFSLYSRLTTTH